MAKNNLWCNDRVRYKEDMHELDLIPKLQNEVRTLRTEQVKQDALYKQACQSIVVQQMKIEQLTKQKDGAYAERNKLVALLSKLFPSCLGRHDITDKEWEDDWRWIVFIDLPTGQVSWHIHDSEYEMFNHLPESHSRQIWDGHTTEEKYERMAAIPDFADAIFVEYDPEKDNYENGRLRPEERPGFCDLYKSVHLVKNDTEKDDGEKRVPALPENERS